MVASCEEEKERKDVLLAEFLIFHRGEKFVSVSLLSFVMVV